MVIHLLSIPALAARRGLSRPAAFFALLAFCAFAGCGRREDVPARETSVVQQALAISFVQQNYATPQTGKTSVAVPYKLAQTAGNLNVVVVGWNDTNASVVSVTDSLGNPYQRAVGPTQRLDLLSQSIYYAPNIAAAAANANIVTVTFNVAAAYADIRVAEYAGIDPASPVEVTAAASGSSATSSTPAVVTTNANDLLVAANMVTSLTRAAGTGWTKRVITSPDGDLLEDRIVTTAGSYGSTASIYSGEWVQQMVAFRAAPSGPDTQPPTAPTNLAATAVSTSQINLTWTAATDNVGVTGYQIESCAGSGCTSFAQIGTATGTTFSNTGLPSGSAFSYRVRATDAAGNLGAYSNTAGATTLAPDTQPPTAPATLAATAVSTSQINLSWTAATDDVGVTAYLVESCAGAGCTSFAQIASVTGTSFNNTGLASGTSFSYRVRARDAAGNLGAYSPTAGATTFAPDTQPPTAPSNLAATAVSISQINLSWTASTDDTGVTAYLVESCTGSGCTSYSQIASVTGTSYNHTGLLGATTYGYRVRATDAAGNLGAYSNAASATTFAPDTQPPTNPSGLTATAASSAQINLGWTASTDDTGVTAYLIERCQGAGCSSFAQVGTATGTSYPDAGLGAATSYSYRVRARDAAGNFSGYSNTASATTPAALFTPTYVQGNYAVPQSGPSSVTVAFGSSQWAGDLNVVAVGWNDSDVTVKSVTDTKGNPYQIAASLVITGVSQTIYYASNIVSANAGENKVTVAWTGGAQFPDVRIHEYRGIAGSSPVDVAISGSGTAATSNSGAVTTTNGMDLLFAANVVQAMTTAAGAGYTARFITQPNSDISEDRVVTAPGSFSATAPLSSSGGAWIMQLVAFKASSSPPPADTNPPIVAITAPATGATLSGTVTVTVTASDAESGVEAAQVLVDGVPASFPDPSSPYQMTIDTTKFANGSHMLGATGLDSARNIGYAPAIAVTFSNGTAGNPAATGYFSGLTTLPIVPVHQAQMPDGKIVVWDGQSMGTDGRIWDTGTNGVSSAPPPVNEFCTGHEQMADGRIFVAGGHNGGAHLGLTAATVYDPVNRSWATLPDMAYPRWYPTVTALPDGRMFVMSGETSCPECYVQIPEIYSPATNSWTRLTNSPFTFPYYPHMFVLPDGRLFVPSTSEDPIVSQIFDFGTLKWTAVGGPAVDGGSAVMYLPWKFLKAGTSVDPDQVSRNSAATAYVIDMSQPSPVWRQIQSMAYARTYGTLTSLPDGTVLMTGGGPTTAATDTARAVRPIELWSPTTETWTTLGSMSAPRLYHSAALLMPDARVLILGGGRFDDATYSTDQFNGEFYSPPYLFKGPRPVIASAPARIQLGQQFTVQTPDAARVAKVSLIRYGSVTHTINMAQRFLPLTFTAGSGSLTVDAPANANLAIPGNYMLFLVDTNGVPSMAATVRL